MPKIKFIADPRHVLEVSADKSVQGGKELEVTDEELKRIKADKSITVEIVSGGVGNVGKEKTK